MKVLVLGATGMLGCAVSKVLSQVKGINLTVTHRGTSSSVDLDFPAHRVGFDSLLDNDLDEWHEFHQLDHPDYIINCIGCIKPYISDSHFNAAYVNGCFPHRLAEWGQCNDVRVIHVTTDCVFTGKTGQYTEADLHDEVDFYAKSKSLGEPENCMVLRTSIIGEEKHKFASLISWVKSQAGKETNGYTNHFWNGVTTTQLGQICQQIMIDDLFAEQLYHVFSPNTVSKFELVTMINKLYDLGITIKPVEVDLCDRSLSTIKDLNAKLNTPELKLQLENMI